MHDWQIAYLGRRTFPANLTDFELRQAFTLDAAAITAIRHAFRSRLRVAAALQWGFLRLSGVPLSVIDHIPASVLQYLGKQLDMPVPELATLRSLYRRKQTRRAHRRWAIEYLGFRPLDSQGEHLRTALIHERTHATVAPLRLEQHAREWLYRHRYLIPRARRLSQRVGTILNDVMQEDHAALAAALGTQKLQVCVHRLRERRTGHAMTHLEWLRRPPGKRSLKTMRMLYDKYVWLESLLRQHRGLPIPRERQRVYARRFRRRRTAHIAQLPSLRQELEAVCFAMGDAGNTRG